MSGQANPYNIFSAAASRNHHLYDQMRREDPVHRALHPETGQVHWFLTRYDDCLTFLKDKRFTREVTPADGDAYSLINQHMLMLDNPAHDRLKSLVHVAFTPLNIAILHDRFQAIATDLFNVMDLQVADGEEVDLTQVYIAQFPLRAIMDLLGFDERDYQRLHAWTQGMVSPDHRLAMHNVGEFSDYLDGEITRRRHQPRPDVDLFSGLVVAERNGDRLNRQELLAMTYLLITAGYETMVNFITNSVLSFFEYPDQLDLFRHHVDDPVIVKGAIEELLRFNGPSHMTLDSYALENLTIGDKQVGEGEIVHAVLLAANHDPLVFQTPHELDIFRTPNKHIAFSYGIHHCLGAALARLQGDIAITTLVRRIPNL